LYVFLIAELSTWDQHEANSDIDEVLGVLAATEHQAVNGPNGTFFLKITLLSSFVDTFFRTSITASSCHWESGTHCLFGSYCFNTNMSHMEEYLSRERLVLFMSVHNN